MKIVEVINHKQFPEQFVDRDYIRSLVTDAVTVAQVRPRVELKRNQQTFLLVRDAATVLGLLVLDKPKTVNGTRYETLRLIYVFPEYRKTSATHWLVFAVKEELAHPLMVDGAIFQAGGELVLSLLKHQSIRASVINKQTGIVEPLTQLVNDPKLAYVFEKTELGYSADYFKNGSPVWLTVFEDVDTI